MLISAALSLTKMPSQAQSTAFTYQGRLNNGANPASGLYDLRFALLLGATSCLAIGPVISNWSSISNSLFTEGGSETPVRETRAAA